MMKRDFRQQCATVCGSEPVEFGFIFWRIFDSNIKVDTNMGLYRRGEFSQNIKVVSPIANSERPVLRQSIGQNR